MFPDALRQTLRFVFIVTDHASILPPLDQARASIRAGATMIVYRDSSFSIDQFTDIEQIRDLCRTQMVPFLIDGNVLLAKAVNADGVIIGENKAGDARKILGERALVGIRIRRPGSPDRSAAEAADVLLTGTVDLEQILDASPLPVVAVLESKVDDVRDCLASGAAGAALLGSSCPPENTAARLESIGRACGCTPRGSLERPWRDEFGLIDRLIRRAVSQDGDASPVIIPPGDDACLLTAIKRPVISTDAQRERVHFRLDWQTPREIGYKAVVVTLSDLAACYAEPVSLFVNLTLPATISERVVIDLYEGLYEALGEYGCTLGGGNVSSGAAMALDLFAVGRGLEDLFPLRSAARPGYLLCCTGPLGLARAGLHCLLKKDPAFPALVRAFKSPRARFDAAKILARHRIECAMDISDGLIGDAGHIARASGVTIELNLHPEAAAPELAAFCSHCDKNPVEVMMAGGEDYELLFACPPEVFKSLKKELPNACPVGRCLPFSGEHLINLPAGVSSYQHGQR